MQQYTKCLSTGKYFSEALILASVNPQYDERLFNEIQDKYKFRTCCVQKLFFVFVLTFKTIHFNEQSLVILWVNWFKNESFWHRFTCTHYFTSYIFVSNGWCLLESGNSKLHSFLSTLHGEGVFFHYTSCRKYHYLLTI